MAQYQVRSIPSNVHDPKIRSAIDMLLSSDSVEVTEPTVQLTECSPDVDVVMNKQGGICTRCNAMFKSRISLLNHIERCLNVLEGTEDNESEDESPVQLIPNGRTKRMNGMIQLKIPAQISPKLIIVPR